MYSAINALNLLSSGNTNVDVKVKGNDEVSQIASAVKSFREALLNYGNVRATALKNRQDQEEKIEQLVDALENELHNFEK